jgi:uncharacterized cupin superfamily protein
MHPPGEAHQLLNTGATDMIYHLITDNPESDACYYPDSDKWSLPGHSRPVRVQPADYYDGEEFATATRIGPVEAGGRGGHDFLRNG